MNSASLASFCALIVVVTLSARPGSAQVSCYSCTGSSANSGDPCGATLNLQGSTVQTNSGCASCGKQTITTGGVTTYYRSCLPTTPSQSNTGCCSMSQISSCSYACSANLCNSASTLIVSTFYGRLIVTVLALVTAVIAKNLF